MKLHKSAKIVWLRGEERVEDLWGRPCLRHKNVTLKMVPAQAEHQSLFRKYVAVHPFPPPGGYVVSKVVNNVVGTWSETRSVCGRWGGPYVIGMLAVTWSATRSDYRRKTDVLFVSLPLADSLSGLQTPHSVLNTSKEGFMYNFSQFTNVALQRVRQKTSHTWNDYVSREVLTPLLGKFHILQIPSSHNE